MRQRFYCAKKWSFVFNSCGAQFSLNIDVSIKFDSISFHHEKLLLNHGAITVDGIIESRKCFICNINGPLILYINISFKRLGTLSSPLCTLIKVTLFSILIL